MAKRTPQELAISKQNQKLLKNLKRRIKNLNKKFGATPATKKLLELKVPMYTKGLSLQQLKDQRRDLLYITSLKTSYVKGMKNFLEHWEKIDTYLKQSGPETENKFWEIYNKFVEEHAIMHKFKYDVSEVIYAGMSEGKTEEQIEENLKTLFNAIQYGEEPMANDATRTRLFYINKKAR